MNITLIDPHPVLRVGMTLFLTESYNNPKISLAESLAKYSECTEDDESDLIILGLPEEDCNLNTVLINQIRQQRPETEIIVLAGKGDYNTAMSAMFSGAKGYILKKNEPEEVIRCIDTVMSGKRYLCREFSQGMLHEGIQQIGPKE